MPLVFFGFDYDDVWRVNQVRKSGAFVGERRSGFRDKAEYEQVKRQGDTAIKRWIRAQMQGYSATCILIGSATHEDAGRRRVATLQSFSEGQTASSVRRSECGRRIGRLVQLRPASEKRGTLFTIARLL